MANKRWEISFQRFPPPRPPPPSHYPRANSIFLGISTHLFPISAQQHHIHTNRNPDRVRKYSRSSPQWVQCKEMAGDGNEKSLVSNLKWKIKSGCGFAAEWMCVWAHQEETEIEDDSNGHWHSINTRQRNEKTSGRSPSFNFRKWFWAAVCLSGLAFCLSQSRRSISNYEWWRPG